MFHVLLRAVPARYRALVALAAWTGLRWGECVALRWDAVDLVAETVRVIPVAEEVSGHVSLKPYPKSQAGRRVVPIPQAVVKALRQQGQASPPSTSWVLVVGSEVST